MGLIFGTWEGGHTEGVYTMAQFSAAIMACALTGPQLSKPLRGRPPPALQRIAWGAYWVLTSPWRKKKKLTAPDIAIQKQAAKYAAKTGGAAAAAAAGGGEGEGGKGGGGGGSGPGTPGPGFLASAQQLATPARTPEILSSTPGRFSATSTAGLVPQDGKPARWRGCGVVDGCGSKSPARQVSGAQRGVRIG